MAQNAPTWICCQLGAREHYAIPRALHQTGQLAYLITDAWIPPQSVLNLFPKPILLNLRERFHPDLIQPNVYSSTNDLIRFELLHLIQRTSEWERTISRNLWFQQKALQILDQISWQFLNSGICPTLFAYSYAALNLFRYAKTKGWRTILGQINPGPVEEKIVQAEYAKYSDYSLKWQPAPSRYWADWREECELADRIVVNSLWSSHALQQAGICVNKIHIIPLAYQPPEPSQEFVRIYPSAFSAERPLRVLFLGQVILRKGLLPLLEAAKLLDKQPVEFWLVGPLGITKPEVDRLGPLFRCIGAVSRSETTQYYQQADIFLFPTLSDGFGLTQLEAQAWKLPIIASQFCGKVVKDQVNGLLLSEVTGRAIANALQFCLKNPEELQIFSRQSIHLLEFNLSRLQWNLNLLLTSKDIRETKE